MPAAKQPEPVTATTVCSMCGLDWKLHGKTPTAEDCIRLLKLELAKRPVSIPWYGQTWPTRQAAQSTYQTTVSHGTV